MDKEVTGRPEVNISEERSYVAFISYRHKDLDREAAVKIQRHIERYIVPKEFREKVGGKNLGIVFRDEDELPASSSLSDSITYALDHTQFLIVICTPDLPKSRWCEQEIRYFLKTHSRDNIIAVLADGEPDESFSRYLLHDYDEEGNVIADREPLAANIKGPDHTIDKKAFRKEIVRLYAALIGCPFDSLWQRERRRKTNILIAVLGGIMALLVSFLALVISNNMKITEKNREIEAQNETINEQNLNLQKQMSSMQVEAGQTALKEYDPKGAVNNALQAIGDGDRRIYDRRVEKLLSDITGAYQYRKKRNITFYEQSTDIADLLASEDQKHVYISDQVGYVRCIDVMSGDVEWETLTNRTKSKLGKTDLYLAAGGKVLIARDNKVIEGLDPVTGESLWSYTYVMTEGTTLRALSPDGKRFALADRIDGDYWLIQLDTLSGEVLASTQIPYVYLTTVIDNDWYHYGASYSKDSGLLVIAYYMKDKEDDTDQGYVYLLLDSETGDIKAQRRWNDENSSRSIFFGIVVENGTGNMFCAQYHSRYGSIMMLRIDWEKDDNKIDKVNFTISEDYFLQEQDFVPMLWNEDIAAVFAERMIYIFDPRTNTFRKSYQYGGEIKDAWWLDQDEAVLEMVLENGEAWVYDLEPEGSIFSVASMEETGQTDIHLAQSYNGGLSRHGYSDDGMYVTVTDGAPGKLIRVEEHTDPSYLRLGGFDAGDYYNMHYSVIPGTDELMINIRHPDGDEIFVYDPVEDRVVSRQSYEDHFYNALVAIDRETFISGNMIYHLGGEPEWFDGVNEENDFHFSGFSMKHAQMHDGNIVTFLEPYYDQGFFRIFYWLNGKMVSGPSCYEEGMKMELESYDFTNALSGIGRNGFVYVAGKTKQSGKYDLYCMEVETEKQYTLDLPVAFDEEILGCPGNDKGIIAISGDGGKVFLGDIRNMTWTRFTQGYDRFEIQKMCFTENDECLLLYTKAGRLDIYDTATKSLIYSGNMNAYVTDPQYISTIEGTRDGETVYVKLTSYSDTFGTWIKIDTSADIICQEVHEVMYHDLSNRRLYAKREDDDLVWYPEKTMEMLVEDAEELLE